MFLNDFPHSLQLICCCSPLCLAIICLLASDFCIKSFPQMQHFALPSTLGSMKSSATKPLIDYNYKLKTIGWKKTTKILNNFIQSDKFHEFVSYEPSLTDLFCISCDTGGMLQVQIHNELSKCVSCNLICSAQSAFHTGHSNNSPLQK